MAGDTGQYWDPLVMQQELSPVEKQLRDRFVTEYLTDHNAYLAAIRVGYIKSVASDYASFLMSDPYVQREISRRTTDTSKANSKEQLTQDRHTVKQWLIQEARFHGIGSSHSARVQALAKLCNILDMDGTTKIKSEVTHKGGVMLVPGIAKLDEWEKQAATQQDKLIADSAEDRAGKPVH
jgi:hypothetical protein